MIKSKIMKKVCLVAVIVIFSIVSINAQGANFGVTAGYHSLSVKASVSGASASSGESGVFVGVFADLTVSEKFHVQPEIQYASVFADGGSGNELIIPIMAKYYASDKFFVQAGPQFDLILEDSDGIKKFGIGLGAGVGYEFSDQLFATTRYTLGLSDRLDDSALGSEFESLDITTKFNFFQIGIGYRFN
jgi:opacity protein-like surface antigen